jgi:hypothetical protein
MASPARNAAAVTVLDKESRLRRRLVASDAAEQQVYAHPFCRLQLVHVCPSVLIDSPRPVVYTLPPPQTPRGNDRLRTPQQWLEYIAFGCFTGHLKKIDVLSNRKWNKLDIDVAVIWCLCRQFLWDNRLAWSHWANFYFVYSESRGCISCVKIISKEELLNYLMILISNIIFKSSVYFH